MGKGREIGARFPRFLLGAYIFVGVRRSFDAPFTLCVELCRDIMVFSKIFCPCLLREFGADLSLIRVFFYVVKALYDYQATIDEEFDFQTGDIIAVTATPEDGWWSGELLDEARRQRGRHVFPSNFVCLF